MPRKKLKIIGKLGKTHSKISQLATKWSKKANEFTTQKILHPKFHDKKFRLLPRKTQFNDQLSKHQNQTKKTCYFCENYGSGTEVQNKETLEHAVFSCTNVKKIPEQVLNHLRIPHLTQLPISASQIVLYDEFSTGKNIG